MLYGPPAFVSQAETLTLALAGSFLISVCIGTILDVSQAISPNDELLILLQYFFFLSSLRDAWEPGRDPMPLLHTSYVLLRYEKAPFIGGVEERSIQFPNLIFALREMFLFLMPLAHARIQTHSHKWSLPCCSSIPQGYGHAFSLHINFFYLYFLAFCDS